MATPFSANSRVMVLEAIVGDVPCPHHGDGQRFVQPLQAAPDIEHRRIAVYLPQPLGVLWVVGGEDIAAVVGAEVQYPPGRLLGGGFGQIAHLHRGKDAASGQLAQRLFKDGGGMAEASEQLLGPGGAVAEGPLEAEPGELSFHSPPPSPCRSSPT